MGNKNTCGFCPMYSDMTLDKKESFLMRENFEINKDLESTRSQKTIANLDVKANKIQVNFRKLKSLKILSKHYLEKLMNLAQKENFKIYETSKKCFIAKIDLEIKDILTNKIGITSLEKTNIHYITHNFKNIPSDKILNDLKVFRIQLDPVVISNCSNSTNLESHLNEFYWGEWNLKFKKHGFGFLISTKSDFYLGTFKDNVMDGVGLLIINNKNLSTKIVNNASLSLNNNINNVNNISNNNDNKKILENKDSMETQIFAKNENKVADLHNNHNNDLTYNKDNNHNNLCKNSNNTSLVNTNLSNTLNSNSNTFNKARTDSLYAKETFYRTYQEKNQNELSNSNNNNCDQEKKYESKMSDFSKKLVSFLRSPQNTNYNQKDNKSKNEISDKEIFNEISDNEYTQMLQNQRLTCEIYIGEFKRGVAEGYGRLFSQTGDWYIGYFKNNRKDGEGEMHFSDGSFYIGNFKNNVMEGEGKYFFKNGSHFSGNFKDGKFCGKGKMAWKDGRKHSGFWENHMLSGQGTHMWANGNIFEGIYKLNAKSGKGVFYWDQTKYYEGEFLNNKINGKGLFNVGAYVLKGSWKFGKLSFVGDMLVKSKVFPCEDFMQFNAKDSEFHLKKADNKNDKNAQLNKHLDKQENYSERDRDNRVSVTVHN